MKLSIHRLGLFILLGYCLMACNKNGSKTGGGGKGSTTLTLSTSTVQRGQPLIASLSSGASAINVHWAVSPAPAVHITSGNGQAMVLFANPGVYEVSAYYSGSDTSSSDSTKGIVTVTDSVYGSTPPSLTYDTVSLAGDQLKITPLSDSAGELILLVQSVNQYDCFGSFIYSLSYSASLPGPLVFRPTNVVAGTASTPCNGASNQATSYVFVDPDGGHQLPNGTYPFSVVLNNVIYSGTLVKTDTNYTFDWDYSSGVTISPLQINR